MVSEYYGRIKSLSTSFLVTDVRVDSLRRWNTFPLTDCVAAMLHYTTLVVTAFSFVSAHIAWFELHTDPP